MVIMHIKSEKMVDNQLHLLKKVLFYSVVILDVSCNEAVLVLETMARLGAKFCFRNRLELDQLLKAGIPGEDLFFRSSFKVASHMR